MEMSFANQVSCGILTDVYKRQVLRRNLLQISLSQEEALSCRIVRRHLQTAKEILAMAKRI